MEILRMIYRELELSAIKGNEVVERMGVDISVTE